MHAQLATDTKMFCSCAYAFGDPPNSSLCPVCSGQPGSLPVINREAIVLGIKAALALGGHIRTTSIFARKNYFYPDLPKGYQISQFDKPYCEGGEVPFMGKDGRERRIPLKRIHFEEDAGKLIHASQRKTLVDLNRAGVPLIEIVSEPALKTAEEASAYLRMLHNTLRSLGICHGNLEQGHFRCDANVSLRPHGQEKLGTKVELKNINSFRYVEKAIEFEIERQAECLDHKTPILMETRGWNADQGTTESMRQKEEAQDYRYFPEPDLAPLLIDEQWLADARQSLVETPWKRTERFQKDLGLEPYDASVLTSEKNLADYFEEALTACPNQSKAVSNWVLNELLGRLNAKNIAIENSPVPSGQLGELVARIQKGELSGKMGKDLLDDMLATGESVAILIKRKGLTQIQDSTQIVALAKTVLEKNPKQVADYKLGKTKLLGFFVGLVMKESKGLASPTMTNQVVLDLLEKWPTP